MSPSTKTAHTPGPWIIEADKHGILVLADGAGLSISVTIPGRRPSDEDRANAALIAAAPDLLAALQELLAEVKKIPAMNGRDFNGLGIRVNNAIAKAEARQ